MAKHIGRSATRRDVAQLAGVSDAVVSYTLNGGAPVAAATAKRVLDAVAELGYRPNQAARTLKSGSARTLGLIVPDGADPIFANPFFSEYASMLETSVRAENYALYTTASSFLPEAVAGRFKELAAQQVDGILVLPGDTPLDRGSLDDVGVPWIELNAATPQSGINSLGTDLREGAFIATSHLFAHGHTRVGFVGELNAAEPRYVGWLEACAAAKVPAGPFIQTAITRPGGYDAGKRIIASEDRPTALFVASDRTAIGVLRAFNENGVSVPDDIAMVAFDGSWEGEYSWPSLTSFRQPIEAMSRSAVERLLQRESSPARHEFFSGELVTRRSCGCSDALPG